MNLVIKLCRWFDGFAVKMGDFVLIVLPAMVIILGAFLFLFHVSIYIIGRFL